MKLRCRKAAGLLALTVGAISLLSACIARAPAHAAADLVLLGGRVYTMDDSRSWAEAVALDDGKIVFVGSDVDASAFVGPKTRVLELEGKMVLPGFQDSHVHPVTGGIELGQCNLNNLTTAAAVFEKVRSCATENPDREWIVGGGWDLPLFPDANPQRSALDETVPDRPVYLSSADGHSAWVNSKALEAAGVDARTPDPPNGRIERDKKGNPSGTLRESAMDLVASHMPKLTPEDYAEGLKRGLAMANGFGITSFVEADADDDVLEAYATLARANELTARVRISLAVDPTRDESQVADIVKKRDEQAPLLRADSAKIFADGVIEARTAALLQPYIGLGHRGKLNYEPETLNRIVAALDHEGFQVHIHAIGDWAIRASLDAFEHARQENGPRDSRHQIAHLELIDPSDIPRFKTLGVVADFQPLWAFADSYITDLTEPALGPERSRWLYPIKSVVDTGAVVAAGSDWSVSSMNPLDGIQVAITRRDLTAGPGPAWIPEECVDLDTILSAYTRAGAYVQHQEKLTGTIEVGKRADVIVLDRNLFDIPPQEIHEAKVLLTLFDGKPVFQDSSLKLTMDKED
jgi:predicted amidohydrolase YtcJ